MRAGLRAGTEHVADCVHVLKAGPDGRLEVVTFADLVPVVEDDDLLGYGHPASPTVPSRRPAAARLDPDNEVTQANLAVLEYIAEHGGTFSDFLLRPVDEAEIERLSEEDDVEQLDRLCGAYNRDRLEAFGQWMAADADKRSRCAVMLDTLASFFDFVDRVANMAGLLNERLTTRSGTMTLWMRTRRRRFARSCSGTITSGRTSEP